MDKLPFLCAQEFMDELIDTATSSSDESEEKYQNMNVLTLLCAQHLIDDLLESSSSSDEDDEFIALLSYKLLESSNELSKCRDNITVPTKRHEEQSPKTKYNNSLPKSKYNTLRKKKASKSSNGAKETSFGKDDAFKEFDISSMFQKREISTILAKHDVEAKLKRNSRKRQASISSEEDIEMDSLLSLCNVKDSPFDERIVDSLSENEFQHYFSISRGSATYILDKFSSWYYKSYEHIAGNSNIKTTILAFLWFCTNPVSIESVARMFNASLVETRHSFHTILDFFEKELASEIIKLPYSYIEKEAIAKDFEKIDGFPNVLGCLAESYLSPKIPELIQTCGGSQLYLRGVCDANMKFISIKIGISNESNDDTFLEKDLPKLCFPKYHLLGEAEYPIRDHLMIPYDNSENLSEFKKYFNTKYYRTHVKIKSAFGTLRNRFRQFNYLDFNNVDILSKFIVACCILHNICIDRQDFYDGDADNETNTDTSNPPFESSLSSAKSDEFLKHLGIMKRNELTQVLFRAKNKN